MLQAISALVAGSDRETVSLHHLIAFTQCASRVVKLLGYTSLGYPTILRHWKRPVGHFRSALIT